MVIAEKLATKFQALSILCVFLFNLYSKLGRLCTLKTEAQRDELAGPNLSD